MDCKRFGKLFGGCKFQPRFEVIPPHPGQLGCLSKPILTCELEALIERRWAGEACIRCGKVVERPLSKQGEG